MLDNTTWAFIGLVIFLAVIGYFGVYGMLGRALDKRGSTVEAELAAARKLREDAAALLAEYQAKRAQAEKDAADIVAFAEQEAVRMAEEAKIALQDQIARRTAAVEAKIALAETQALAEVRSLAVDVAIAAATRILSEKMSGDLSADLLAKGLSEVKARLN